MALIVHFSGFASSCYQITRNEIDWSFFYFSMRHLPTPLSNSFQWQAQVHMSLKHTFVAADACVATTRLIWWARAWDLTLSNSDLLGTNRLDCSTAKLKGMSTLKVLTWDSKSLNMSFFLGQRRPSNSRSVCISQLLQISHRVKSCQLPLLFCQT